MRVSVITAVRNGQDTLEEAILSVRSQDYPGTEHVVIEGASTDGTMQIIDRYRQSISAFLSEPDSGIYDALNKGIRIASGDVIGVLHSDDVFADPKVVSAVAEAFRGGQVDVAYGDLLYVARNDLRRVRRVWRSGHFDSRALRWGWMPPHPAVFVSRKHLEKVGGFDTSYRIAADYEWLLRVLRAPDTRCVYIPRTFVRMRVGGISNGTLRGVLRKSAEDLRAMRAHQVGGLVTLLAKNVRKISQLRG